MSRCRSCNAPIVWTATASAADPETYARMPLDPDPATDGNVRREGRFTVSGAEVVTVLGPLEREIEDGPLFLSHFVTCPQAEEWRTRR